MTKTMKTLKYMSTTSTIDTAYSTSSSSQDLDRNMNPSTTTTMMTKTSSSSCTTQMNMMGLFLVCTTPMLGGLLYGMDIGVTSFVLSIMLSGSVRQDQEEQQQEQSLSPELSIVPSSTTWWWWSDLSSMQQGLIVSAISLGALTGSHIVLTYLSRKGVGRRMELRLSAMFFGVGTILNCLSGTILSSTVTIPAIVGFLSLFVGRLLFGIGVGFVMHGAPAYLAEMVPAKIRGAVVSFKETVIVGGIVIGYAVGNIAVSSSSSSSVGNQSDICWAKLYAFTGWVSIPMFLLTFYIPRSKRWLIQQGHIEEALESMKFICRGDNIHHEFDILVESVLATTTTNHKTTTETYDSNPKHHPSLFDRKYRKAMVASMGLIIFQQCSGQPSILSYATVLFDAAGWSGNASVVTSVLMMLTSMSTVLLIERVGRKALLCTCCAVMVVALSALSTAFWGWDDPDPDVNDIGGYDENEFKSTAPRHPQQYIILIAMFVYIGGYQLGFGPITWTIVSEVFPIEIRATAIAAGVELNYGLNFLVQFIFPILQERLGWGPCFCLFASILSFAFFFVKAFVPETTGLTLEQIQVELLSDEGDDDKDWPHGRTIQDESSLLLSRVDSSSILLGGSLNIEEMETGLHQKQSYTNLATKAYL